MFTTTTPGGQRVTICTCTRTGRHPATFTRRPGSSLYTLTSEPQVAASAQVSASPPPLPPFACPALPSLRDFCCGEGILQTFTLPDSPQQNGISEHRIGLVIEVAHTSMIHAAAPHFLWPFAVWYAAHQLNLWPRVSLSETSPTLRWTGEVGDVPVFWVWGSRPFVCDTVLLPQTGGAEPGGVETGVGEPGGAEPEGVDPGGAASEGVESGGAEPHGAASFGGSAGASPRLSPQQLREWFFRRARLRSGATGVGGAAAAGAGGVGVAVTGGTATNCPGGARTRGTRAAGTGCVEGAGAGDPTESRAIGAGGSGAGGAGAGGAGVGGPGVGGAGAGGAGAVDPSGAVRPRLYFVPLLQQPASLVPAPSPYTEQSSSLTEHRELASRPVLPVRTAPRVPRLRPLPVPGTHAMTLRPSSVPPRVPLPSPLESSLLEVPDPVSDRARAASPTVSCLLATAVTDPSFESVAASALVAELLDFAAACRLDYATALVAASASASPLSVEGECALGTDVLEDKQEDFECLAAAVPHFASMQLAPEVDADAPDIPTPRSYAEAITGTEWSLRRPVYGLRQAPREWHDTLRTTLAALGFAPATADPSLFLRTDTLLPPFYILVYVDELVFATADTEALTLVKSELQKRHTCTDLGELRSYLGLQITRDRAQHTITLT
ncbi:unnamed protein product [Closterium sp. NIES-54]